MICDPSTHHNLVDGVGVPLVTERCTEVTFTGVGAGYEVERHGYFQTPLSKEPGVTRRKVVNKDNQSERSYIIRDQVSCPPAGWAKKGRVELFSLFLKKSFFFSIFSVHPSQWKMENRKEKKNPDLPTGFFGSHPADRKHFFT